jgi:hypothetical protein
VSQCAPLAIISLMNLIISELPPKEFQLKNSNIRTQLCVIKYPVLTDISVMIGKLLFISKQQGVVTQTTRVRIIFSLQQNIQRILFSYRPLHIIL